MRAASGSARALSLTWTTSLALTLTAGEVTTTPFSLTRPSAISFSASRREQIPARAMTLAMRLPSLMPDSRWVGAGPAWTGLLSGAAGVWGLNVLAGALRAPAGFWRPGTVTPAHG